MNGTQYTAHQLAIVMQHYADTPTAQVASMVGRSSASISKLANRLGIKKSDAYMASYNSGRWNVLGDNSKQYRFAKGSVPANKGVKMTKEHYAKSKATMFAKGIIPHNTYATDGVITIRKHKGGLSYKWIRLSLNNWMPLHQHLWEQAHGKYSSVYCLWFINRNSLDARLDNLELITRYENIARNRQAHRALPPELQTTKKLIKQLKTKITKNDNTI